MVDKCKSILSRGTGKASLATQHTHMSRFRVAAAAVCRERSCS